ncbi:GNAT family N-acetyltransferase [uncultured Shimia sp.]|uniref:GNAT family N-acetyltransferase n=1 Tax=uncultured Shimia sp. TaxID=573152 RepID=UPI00260EAAD7|nr:GNAT family N-acetyltransferase [uncultured Shimia sp.]
MVKPEIRRARKSDAAFLGPLVDRASEGLASHLWATLAEVGQSAEDFGLERIQSEDAGISYTNAWVAEIEGPPLGCLIAYQKPEVPEELASDVSPLFEPLMVLEREAYATGYVFVLSTVCHARGQGIGSSLLTFAERYRGSRGMSLIVADNNTGARKLYERHGYEVCARQPMQKNGWESEGEEWLLMIKPVSR